MDAKEWFAKKKTDMKEFLEELDFNIHDLKEYKSSEIYRDHDDKSIQWEICVIYRSLKE